MHNEIALLLRGLGDKMDPRISAFLVDGLESGAFDFSVYTEVYDVKIVVNQGNEEVLQKLVEKFKLITNRETYRVIERCLSLDFEEVNHFHDDGDAGGLIKRTTRFLNRPPKIDPLHLGPFARKRLLDYGPTIDRITDGIAANCRGFSRLEAFIVAWVVTDTFLHTSENKSRMDSFRSVGKVDRKCWITQRDEKVRPAHEVAERQEVNLYEPFTVADEKMDYPGDPKASFENILLCRCYMVPVS